MDFNNVVYLQSTVITGGEANPNANAGAAAPAAANTNAGTTAASTAAPAAAKGGLFGGGSGSFGVTTILIYVALFAALYFLMIRPQKKRESAVKEMQAALKVGDNIITASGLYGTIVSVGDDCFVVEFGTNKGVRIPVGKASVVGVRTPNFSASAKDSE